ncbi:DUF4270 domain-containing protein [Psychroflexus tropicus]|uniref:DUF4270 domain-containing protein n=1 Tax=Psychroflexus tropicus TaxID=197345 RepID=UPI00035FEDA7|nr:DUF4270 domain-containing protein [Psychroflexus tropicus]
MSKFALRSLASLILLVLLFSCENDFSEVGTDFINSIESQPTYESENIIAYSEKHNSIRTNGGTNYFLGRYADPVFGLSETKILTQVNLSQTNPSFGEDPILDSVVMTLPFYSSPVNEDEFALDSVYGEGSFKVKLYESNQLLRDIDPGENGDFDSAQLYYSNQLDEFRPNISSVPFYTSDVIKPTELTEPVTVYDRNSQGEVDTLSLSPRLRLKLPNDYFQEKIIDLEGSEVLASNSAFNNFLRGFLIEAEQQQPVSSMSLFNMQNEDANITMYYRNIEVDSIGNPSDTLYNQYNLNFNGIKLNLYENNFNVDLTNQDTIAGEENIYLKGGEGSSGVIELFAGPDSDGDGVSDELEELRENNWLINEASLDLYINEQIAPSSKNRINRIFLFDLENEQVLEDFVRDPSAVQGNPSVSRVIHLGPLSEDENGDPFYRIRLTSHINSILNNENSTDSTNVKLGVYVTTNVDASTLVKTRDPELGLSENVPQSMLETPRGIVIHGNRSATETKKMKLKIIYTETN